MTTAPLHTTDTDGSRRQPRTVVISGASGLIGSALTRALQADGVRVLRLVRRPAQRDDEIAWRPDRGEIDRAALDDAMRGDPDAIVVHLAGENLAQRWSDGAKQRIRASRVESTALLAATLAASSHRPRALLSGSAVGIYGDRGDEVLDESSTPGSGFLADVCTAWEAATEPASAAGIRVVHLRTGLVLAREGGVLAKMLLPFRLGLGGPLGNGRQWMSWIALEDHVRAVRFLMRAAEVSGAVNLVAPAPVMQREFARVLGRVLGRPVVLPVPRFVLELALGEMADGALLASQRVQPGRLERAGFGFAFRDLESAMRKALAS